MRDDRSGMTGEISLQHISEHSLAHFIKANGQTHRGFLVLGEIFKLQGPLSVILTVLTIFL